jgi:hypothetical protein
MGAFNWAIIWRTLVEARRNTNWTQNGQAAEAGFNRPEVLIWGVSVDRTGKRA